MLIVEQRGNWVVCFKERLDRLACSVAARGCESSALGLQICQFWLSTRVGSPQQLRMRKNG